MSNWYTTRESFKLALGITDSKSDALIDKHIGGASRTLERQLNRRFIPKTQTRTYPWPQRTQDTKQILWLDEDLLSVDTLKTANETVTIAADDYFLEPANTGPPYRSIEIDLGDNVATDAEFTTDDSSQRAISVAGSWGYSEDTLSAGTLNDASGISASDTTIQVSDLALIDVGDMLLIESEQVFVSERILPDKLTVIRGVNGTTAATHDDATAITKYAPPEDIQNLCRAEAIFNYEQDRSGHTGVVAGIESGVGVRPSALAALWRRAIADYRKWTVA